MPPLKYTIILFVTICGYGFYEISNRKPSLEHIAKDAEFFYQLKNDVKPYFDSVHSGDNADVGIQEISLYRLYQLKMLSKDMIDKAIRTTSCPNVHGITVEMNPTENDFAMNLDEIVCLAKREKDKDIKKFNMKIKLSNDSKTIVF
ncbi:MAG: hypothetical protein HAW67_01440 [Endozoicomonadaceae bacterium]|nr:hypothetical protein [Endozoicomonadaceae bacterium]